MSPATLRHCLSISGPLPLFQLVIYANTAQMHLPFTPCVTEYMSRHFSPFVPVTLSTVDPPAVFSSLNSE